MLHLLPPAKQLTPKRSALSAREELTRQLVVGAIEVPGVGEALFPALAAHPGKRRRLEAPRHSPALGRDGPRQHASSSAAERAGRPDSQPPAALCRSSRRGRSAGQGRAGRGQPASSSPATGGAKPELSPLRRGSSASRARLCAQRCSSPAFTRAGFLALGQGDGRAAPRLPAREAPLQPRDAAGGASPWSEGSAFPGGRGGKSEAPGGGGRRGSRPAAKE